MREDSRQSAAAAAGKSLCVDRVDAAVVGTGPAGLAAALALARLGIETLSLGPVPPRSAANPDTRTAALLTGSIEFLVTIGVWDTCRHVAQPLEVIRIIDDTGRLIRAPDMEFRAEEIGLQAFGYNIANSALVSALFGRLAVEPHVRHVPTQAVTALQPGPSTVRLETTEGGMVSAKLAVGADGRNSITRAAAGIKTVSWSYEQTALTCTFGHSLDHDNISTEFHGPHGPFTTVPLPGRQSSLVWVERPAEARRLMGLDDEDFAKAMERRLHGHLGDVAAAGRRASFPLKGLTARIFARRRVALISEAAHVLPPIGAQGLNLGFRDIIQLAGYVSKACAGGEDIGDDDLLRAYNNDRRGDVWSRSAAADLLNRSLLPGILPFQAARAIGLHILNIASPLRHFVMRQGLAPATGKVL